MTFVRHLAVVIGQIDSVQSEARKKREVFQTKRIIINFCLSHDQQVTDKITLNIFIKFTNISPYTILILLYFRHELY